MRIVQAAGWFFPDRLGGTEVYVAGLSKRLAARGHDVRIAAPDASSDAAREYMHEGVRVFRYPVRAPRTRTEAQGRAPIAGADRFHAWVADQRADVVHFHTLVPGLELPEVRAARATAGRIIATTHASSLGYLCSRGTMMRWGRVVCDGVSEVAKCAACELQKRGMHENAARLVAWIPVAASELGRDLPGRYGTAIGMPSMIASNHGRQQDLLDQVDRFVVLTRWAHDVLLRNGAPASKVAVNRLGCGHAAGLTASRSSNGDGSGPIRVSYVGRFDPIKGPEVLARAVRSIARDVPIRVEFRGPAKTDEERACRRAVAQLAAGDPRVMVGPPIPYQDIPAYLASIDVLCCPSLCLEGGPTIAVEAHAAGTPVVGSRIGGLAEIVDDGGNGALVPPGDGAALAAVLTSLAAERGTLARWRAAIPPARTMDDVTEDYVSLYTA